MVIALFGFNAGFVWINGNNVDKIIYFTQD